MKKHIRNVTRPVRSYRRRLTATIIVAIVVLAIGAVSVLSRQRGEANMKTPMTAKKTIVTVVNAPAPSQDIHPDGQGGQPQELTADEAQKLAAGLKDLVNKSTEGLVEVKHGDGSVSVDLEDRFQNVTVARINKDGSVSQSCVDNPKAAAAFFGFDPKLIENSSGGNQGSRPRKMANRN